MRMTPLRIEQSAPTYTYRWLHVPTKVEGSRTIAAGEVEWYGERIWTRAQMLDALNKWNAMGGSSWKYWMD